jgi:hypothetical protein
MLEESMNYIFSEKSSIFRTEYHYAIRRSLYAVSVQNTLESFKSSRGLELEVERAMKYEIHYS